MSLVPNRVNQFQEPVKDWNKQNECAIKELFLQKIQTAIDWLTKVNFLYSNLDWGQEHTFQKLKQQDSKWIIWKVPRAGTLYSTSGIPSTPELHRCVSNTDLLPLTLTKAKQEKPQSQSDSRM